MESEGGFEKVASGELVTQSGAEEPAWARFVEGSSPAGAQGTVRIAALLRIVAAHNSSGMKLNEIAALAGLEQSTAHRIVSALHSVGFLSREPKTRRFYLGPLLFELFTTAFPHFNIRDICLPVMESLARELGDTVYLTVRSGIDGVCVERCEGSHPIRTCTVEVGQRRPLGLGAGSLVLLSTLSDVEVAIILEQNAACYMAYGITEAKLRNQINLARRQGYIDQAAVSSSEVIAVALPIRGRTGHPFGALSMTAVASRMAPTRVDFLVGELRKAIAETECRIAKLGYI